MVAPSTVSGSDGFPPSEQIWTTSVHCLIHLIPLKSCWSKAGCFPYFFSVYALLLVMISIFLSSCSCWLVIWPWIEVIPPVIKELMYWRCLLFLFLFSASCSWSGWFLIFGTAHNQTMMYFASLRWVDPSGWMLVYGSLCSSYYVMG